MTIRTLARQGQGIGTKLLQVVEQYVTDKGLAGITLSTNQYAPAPKFYEKNGFKVMEDGKGMLIRNLEIK